MENRGWPWRWSHSSARDKWEECEATDVLMERSIKSTNWEPQVTDNVWRPQFHSNPKNILRPTSTYRGVKGVEHEQLGVADRGGPAGLHRHVVAIEIHPQVVKQACREGEAGFMQ